MSPFDGVQHVKKLRILALVIESGSFKKAAVRGKVTSPAISQTISSLERLIGKPLLLRENGKVLPTPLALRLLTEASPALDKRSNLLHQLQEPQAPAISWISLGASESLAVGLLPRLIPSLEAKLPGVKLTVRVSQSSALANQIRKGELCAALVTECDSFGNLMTVPLAQDRLGYFVSAALPFQKRSWSEVCRGKIGALSPEGKKGHPRYHQKFIAASLGASLRPALLSDSLEALRAAAVAGAMTAILPARVALRTPGELVEVSPAGLEGRPGGVHAIQLLTQKNCDPREISILCEVLKPLF
jgi:DNA-binding transcriptional LysR family regulator